MNRQMLTSPQQHTDLENTPMCRVWIAHMVPSILTFDGE